MRVGNNIRNNKKIVGILLLVITLLILTIRETEITSADIIQDEVLEYLNSVSTKEYNRTKSNADLFEDNRIGTYNYAPSIVVTDRINTFYCSNKNSGEIIDHIYFRESIPAEYDTYYYSSESIVLSPTPGEWDGVHVCDPSVIYGEFIYNNETYNYLMAYLGCNTLDNQKNKIGLAVSNSLDSGWIKIDANPIIEVPYDYTHKDYFQWGVGQPSILSIDGKGNVLICYTQGTWNLTSQKASVWNLSDLNNPVCIGSCTVSNKGTNDFISNADFAYNNGVMYLICDKHPFKSGVLSNIPDTSCIYYTKLDNIYEIDKLANCNWNPVAYISEYEKNHNTAFFRNLYGRLQSTNIVVTEAKQLKSFEDSLWTYRLKIINIEN